MGAKVLYRRRPRRGLWAPRLPCAAGPLWGLARAVSPPTDTTDAGDARSRARRAPARGAGAADRADSQPGPTRLVRGEVVRGAGRVRCGGGRPETPERAHLERARVP